jgi:serine/threonine protein kinase
MFLDEFEFVKRLGEGAFATVWAARRKDPGGPNHGKLYAIKHLKQRDDGADAAGLLGTPEFRSLKSIARHPHVLRAV